MIVDLGQWCIQLKASFFLNNYENFLPSLNFKSSLQRKMQLHVQDREEKMAQLSILSICIGMGTFQLVWSLYIDSCKNTFNVLNVKILKVFYDERNHK